jgi:hypothetical protein
MTDDKRAKSTRRCNPERVRGCEGLFASELSGRKRWRSEASRARSALVEE